MLRYADTRICVVEIPDEISLGISIYGCNAHCPDCHSKYLWDTNCDESMGTPLTYREIDRLYLENAHISCLLLFGGEHELLYLTRLFAYSRYKYGLKTALYSGREESYFTEQNNYGLFSKLDYLKVGGYVKELGDLRSRTTNQKLYKIHHHETFETINEKLRRE